MQNKFYIRKIIKEKFMLVFVLNAGSSSLKYQLINAKTSELKASGIVERIGIDGVLKHVISENKKLTIEDLKQQLRCEKNIFRTPTSPNGLYLARIFYK